MDLDEDRTSDWVPTTTTRGVPVRVRLQVSAGGFLTTLEMESDARLPRRPQVDTRALRAASRGALDLAGPTELPGLRAWLRDWLGSLPQMCPVTAVPGGPAARAVLESHGTPPAELAALVDRYDGLRVGSRRIVAAREVLVVDLAGTAYWVIDEDDGSHTVLDPRTGRVLTVDKGDDRPVDSGIGLREWFRAGCPSA
ncbi:SUKH-4 family immunity protein [Blastococcus sp. PRF04-17]|uniref:SUKH-4 family immunity protein n=1 Tax=Blastococcus sp. PRF04-17 TaxID=2933797 RepID=UPI001FF4DC09|nr:hypothetical protein [Blastococcus sp. PRF04-17]UOX99902.1 hypothetical protein MVA48_12760 [Blastococcus sp. PRF04-17]